ncbi:hypothetical protein J7443_20815 [Tropicibacter sp. R15_0]|uniref:pectinesterase family protein n=1 Tax=Tropicibacter sp. R15_0 TaxID=2821101 RepID=UPI001ADB4B48|nr:pectinesterase family protein [Tropicibacter sp. R15_0]MBO9467685.1 hypothetical protein [Tropicibacter sp. R15_0]
MSAAQPSLRPDWAARHVAQRPMLSPEQAAQCRPETVLAQGDTAGQAAWDPTRTDDGAEDWVLLVDQNGAGTDSFLTIQAAIESALANRAHRTTVTIAIMPGDYAGLVYIPKTNGAPLSFQFRGLGAAPQDTRITANIDAEMPVAEYLNAFAAQFEDVGPETRALFARMSCGDRLGTNRSAVMRIEADGVSLSNLTIHNTYQATRKAAAPKGAQPDHFGRYSQGQHQAVALHLAGADRLCARHVHLKSFQDTLYLQAPAPGQRNRAYFADCDIEGDVDFIFGHSTAFFETCTIRTLGSRQARSWVVAPATHIDTPYGFVFAKCRFTHDGADFGRNGQSCLGRQWFEGVRASPYGTAPDPSYYTVLASDNKLAGGQSRVTRDSLLSVGKCLLVDCQIGAHISRTAPWDDWSGPGYAADGSLSSGDWRARYRPHQTCAADLIHFLAAWPDLPKLGLETVTDTVPWLGEFNSTHDAMDERHD